MRREWLARAVKRLRLDVDDLTPAVGAARDLGPGEHRAVLLLSAHGYDLQIDLHNRAAGSTEWLARGPFDAAPMHYTSVRLPIEAALEWARQHDYDLESRSDDARCGELTLVAGDDAPPVALRFRGSRNVRADNPVNRLLDAFYAAAYEEPGDDT